MASFSKQLPSLLFPPASSLREALDSFGTAVQVSTVALFLALSLLRQLSRVKSQNNSPKTRTLLGEPLSALALVGSWLLLLGAYGGLYIPSLNTSSTAAAQVKDNPIFYTRLPAHLLAALLPFHVLLSHTSPLNPLPYLLRLPRANLTPYHRALGWSFMVLFAAHGSQYMRFYIEKGILLKRVQDADVQLGMALSTTFSAVAFASRKVIRVQLGRQWVWGHVVAAMAIGGLLWAHVVQTRVYVLQSAAIALVGVAWRAWKVGSAKSAKGRKTA